jgi:hypothetical protein
MHSKEDEADQTGHPQAFRGDRTGNDDCEKDQQRRFNRVDDTAP